MIHKDALDAFDRYPEMRSDFGFWNTNFAGVGAVLFFVGLVATSVVSWSFSQSGDRVAFSDLIAPIITAEDIEQREREAGNIDQAVETVRAFAAETDWKKRAEFVVDRVRVADQMEAFYQFSPPCAKDIGDSVEVSAMLLQGGRKHYLIEAPGDSEFEPSYYTVVHDLDGGENRFLIDWEALTSFNAVSWDEFKARRPAERCRFRVRAELSDYFNRAFEDRRHWLSVAIKNKNREVEVYGYVSRHSELGQTLSRILGARNDVPMILDLRWPPDSRGDHQVLIDRLAQRGWHEMPNQDEEVIPATEMILPAIEISQYDNPT